MSPEP
jgi:hypothetical protein